MMTLEAAQVFAVMETSYRKGVIDKFIPLFGEALEGLMEETGMNMEDLLNKLDEAKPETVEKLNRLLGSSGPLLRLANNDRLMGLVSRILDLELVRRVSIRGLIWFLKRSLAKSEGEFPPLTERLRGYITVIGQRSSGLAGGKPQP
ncbi:MAG: hypothetical protein SWK76_17475 [Actinomycetota bacterium]|nr:hypothetical protein [Actinomycetota bacterium]